MHTQREVCVRTEWGARARAERVSCVRRRGAHTQREGHVCTLREGRNMYHTISERECSRSGTWVLGTS